MPLDFEKGLYGIVCRDVGFLPFLDGRFEKVEMKVDHAYPRKGTRDYARALISHLIRGRPGGFEEAIVIGDGEGDVRFCINLDTMPNQGHLKKVNGLFLKHLSLEKQFQGESDNVVLCSTWNDVSNALSDLLMNSRGRDTPAERCVILADVDRTVLFPRGVCDEGYAEVRLKGFTDYVTGFRGAATTARMRDEIARFSQYAAVHSIDYTNELNDLGFKNEEVVAIISLLLSIGAVVPKWVSGPNHRSLFWMIERSIKAVGQGGWVSGFEMERRGDAETYPGENMWLREDLVSHLLRVQENLRSSKPVLCEEFRTCEGKHVSEFIARRGRDAFNLPLVSTLRTAAPSPVIFLTDRPAASLEFVPEGARESTFWKTLLYLLDSDSI